MSDRVRHVAILGGGVAAAMTALALARRIPGLEVIWVDTGVPDDSVEDVMGAARPSLGQFHRALGLDDGELLRRTNCGSSLGTLVQGWPTRPFFRRHDRLPAGLSGVPLHLLWLRLPQGPERPDWIDLASRESEGAPPALSLDLDDYRSVLGALAKHTGIRRFVAASHDIELDPGGSRIAAIHLPDGERVSADLFLDATGPARALRGRLTGGWIDWSSQLPTRTLSIRRLAPADRPKAHARLVAEPDGWRLETYLPRAMIAITGRGSEAIPGEDEASPASHLSLSPGRLDVPFQANVVALGSAAAVPDAIGATALHLLCRQIERLIAYWPGRIPDPSEVALYNRRSAMEADRMRDFAQLHFLSSGRQSPFWRSANGSISEQLSRDLSLFDARGRLLPSDEDGIGPDEWISALIGLGHRPAQRDALAQAVPLGVARQRIAAVRTGARMLDEEELR
ncbi:MAG: tryptophan 7-halogenase [Sphingomonas sp.]|jgi:tryptophan halogenase